MTNVVGKLRAGAIDLCMTILPMISHSRLLSEYSVTRENARDAAMECFQVKSIVECNQV